MQENGYMMECETREALDKAMKDHERPFVSDKEKRQEFIEQLRKLKRRKELFGK